MSKIGRKPINISKAQVAVAGNTVTIKGAKDQFKHELAQCLSVAIDGDQLTLSLNGGDRKSKALWGLHRALLANKVIGATEGFEKKVKLVGLGYKGQLSGNKIVFSVGYSHKVEYVIPQGVTIESDKSGQNLVVRSTDKFLLGNVCDAIRSIRLPEPYKGTGIIREGDVIIRKAGKTKA